LARGKTLGGGQPKKGPIVQKCAVSFLSRFNLGHIKRRIEKGQGKKGGKEEHHVREGGRSHWRGGKRGPKSRKKEKGRIVEDPREVILTKLVPKSEKDF